MENMPELNHSFLAFVQMKIVLKFINSNLKKNLKIKLDSQLKDLIIKKTNVTDIKSILKIYRICFNNLNYSRVTLNAEKLRDHFNSPNSCGFLAEYEGREIGYILLEVDGVSNKHGIISSVGVLPRYQRSGVGANLILKAFSYFEENHVSQVFCEISLLNQAGYCFLKSVNFENFRLRYEFE